MIRAWSLRPWVDWILAAAAVAVVRIGYSHWDWWAPLEGLSDQGRRELYGQVATVGAAAIGLFVVPVTLALALAPSGRLSRVLEGKQGQLRRASIHVGCASLALIVTSVLGVALDGADRPTGESIAGWVRWLLPALFLVVVFGASRLLRVLSALLRLSEKDRQPATADHIDKSIPKSLRPPAA